ncbi:MOT6-like protein [Mya arenaria]|uniref:MOT6-like protein n=1 Tax=Mya arenaria TaxID=6604 RepID=A0ABY7F8Y9_MYAAR|nr:MOT6-like protein [Mya arenaria]
MYPELINIFNSRRSNAALIQGLYMGLSTGGGILWAPLIQKYGPGKSVLVGSLVTCVGLLASSFAEELWTIILCTGVIAGMGMCTCYLSAFITVSWVFHKDPGVPLVCLTMGSSLGQFVIPYLYEICIEKYAWSGAFILVSGISLQCIPFGLIMYGAQEYFVTGKKASKRKSVCETSLLTDVLVWILLVNCLLVALTGTFESF